MKKALAVCFLLVLLTGCSEGDRALERGMELRTKLLKAEKCGFSVNIAADYGDKLHSFSMDCMGDTQGDLTFAVTAPDTIAGITGTASDTGGSLTFDDTALSFPLLAEGQLSPVSGPWVFLKTLRSGYLTMASAEDECLRLTFHDGYEEDAMQVDVWLNEADIPIRAEILYAGRRILTLDVRNFEIS